MSELKTGVDDLLRVVQTEKKISVPDAAKHLNLSEKVVQQWVDFLVEEHILGMEYKFTTPYVFPLKKTGPKRVVDEIAYSLSDFKDVFITYCQQRQIPEEQHPTLWREHLDAVVRSQKNFFMEECGRRSISDVDTLFSDYVQEVLRGT